MKHKNLFNLFQSCKFETEGRFTCYNLRRLHPVKCHKVLKNYYKSQAFATDLSYQLPLFSHRSP